MNINKLFYLFLSLFPGVVLAAPIAMNYCIPTYYTLSYELGYGCTGTAPTSETLGRGYSFTTPNAATVCGNPNATKWKIVGTNDYITSNTTLGYVWFNDITLKTSVPLRTINSTALIPQTLGWQNDSRGAFGGASGKCTGCSDNEWYIDYGTFVMRGIASCNSNDGRDNRYVAAGNMNSNSTGQHCWCRPTNVFGDNLPTSKWWFNGSFLDSDDCANDCANKCTGTGYGVDQCTTTGLIDVSANADDLTCNDINVTRGTCKGANLTTGGAAGTWVVPFCYGTITGIASCNETSGDNNGQTWRAPSVAAPNTMSTSDTGKNCWCRLNTPTTSSWVFYSTTTDSSACEYDCAYKCADAVNGTQAFRVALFNTI